MGKQKFGPASFTSAVQTVADRARGCSEQEFREAFDLACAVLKFRRGIKRGKAEKAMQPYLGQTARRDLGVLADILSHLLDGCPQGKIEFSEPETHQE